ncbi:MAG: RNA polymerase sigma factor [Candidatus Omnitrophota bacterium]
MQDIPRDWITQAQGGSMEAFEKIYKAISNLIYNVAYRITNNTQDAEEATQDVFIKIHRHLKEFRFRSSFKTWAYRIAVNTAINESRKRSKKTGLVAVYDDHTESRETVNNTRRDLEKREAQAAISSILNKLNCDQRACVVLRDIEGLSYNEIAETLKININTVRSRLKRAREKFLVLKCANSRFG